MDLEIEAGRHRQTVTLEEGFHWLGGGAGDAPQVLGLPSRLLKLEVRAGELRLKPTRRMQVGKAPCEAERERLLLPGERVRLGPRLSFHAPLEPARIEETGAVLRGLVVDPVPSPRACASLSFLSGPELGRQVPLAGDAIVLGRGAEADIRLRDRAISRCHATLRREDGGHVLEDQGGVNGVFLNGLRLTRRTRLTEHDVIGLGVSLLAYRSGAPTGQGRAPPRTREKWLIGLSTGMALGGLAVTVVMSR